MFIFALIGIIGFLGVPVFLIWALVRKFQKKPAKQFMSYAGVSLAVFIIAMIFDPGTEQTSSDSEPEEEQSEEVQATESSEDNKSNENESEEKKTEEPKEELHLSTETLEYDEESDAVTIAGETNVVDGAEITFALLGNGDENYALVPESTTVENGEFEVTLGNFEDNSGQEYVENGEYPVVASFGTQHDEALSSEYESYENFNANYTMQNDANVEETDSGFLVESIDLGDLTIENAYTAEEIENLKLEDKKQSAEQLDFARLQKNPDKHAGTYVTYTGQIIEIQESDNMTYMRLAVTKNDYGYNYDDVIYVEYDDYTEFVEEDEVTIYGNVYGTFDYTSQAGWDMSIPAVVADIVE
ncbi:hypothetical protein J2S78_002056 [Salibacterium salarium]|uniref:hypothetical protein n=1 Tax=Salibacterium salarium TaxID=284579 RepID=UPI002788EA45|nr:hypothetical protein [Salibacterium salarium]MDQ0299636.1 hypothetical protein [Salibacterium salarium]